MMEKKSILFLTGTRADFGKLKSLINITNFSKLFDVHIFITGMHLQQKYGYTFEEIEKCGYKKIFKYINHTSESTMDQTLAKTIEGLSGYIHEMKPDLIVIHGDRVEALAGAIVGSLNNILVAHIEGGEISGTIDELIRHAVSKMSHIHFVSNEVAKKRLIQMGEIPENIYIIGSPDIDVMLSKELPSLIDVKQHYQLSFKDYAVLLFHPVTTEVDDMPQYTKNLVDAIIESGQNFVVIYPNNDLGSTIILKEYERLKNLDRFRIFPSIRFEYFLVLLEHSRFMIGNSSAGVREAPYYGLPVINIGTRQQNRSSLKDIINVDYSLDQISNAISVAPGLKYDKVDLYGKGNSDELFFSVVSNPSFWDIEKQKQFNDIATYA
jgi:UDP-N-acetylglucosamine 2-epimerase (hydrolysing)